MQAKPVLALIAPLAFTAGASFASTPDAWAELDRVSAAACATASGLRDARVGPPVRFSDRAGADARLVTGVWPQPHMRGREARMLCLFDRRNRRAEVQEASDWEIASPAPAGIVGRQWRLSMIDGAPLPSTRAVTLALDAEGGVSGNSGCNRFTGRYRLQGSDLRILPPLASTRRGCEPNAMALEQRVQAALVRVRSWSIGRRGNLILRLAGNGSLQFRPE
jgi:heat shock protein HslJ